VLAAQPLTLLLLVLMSHAAAVRVWAAPARMLSAVK
jgi:hypothetical protein